MIYPQAIMQTMIGMTRTTRKLELGNQKYRRYGVEKRINSKP